MLKQGIKPEEKLKDSLVIDFDEDRNKPKTPMEKIKEKPKVIEYTEKLKFYVKNKGDGELAFEDFEKKMKKKKEKKNGPRSKSRAKSNTSKRSRKGESRSHFDTKNSKPKLTVSMADDVKINKSALKNKTTLNDVKRSASKKSVRIRDESESREGSSKKRKSRQKSKKKLKFNLDNGSGDEENQEAEVNRNGKKKIKTKIKRRQTQKVPNDTQFKKMNNRLSVRL